MVSRLLLLTPFLFCYGFSLTPMSHVIELSENQKQVQFYLDNPTSEPMAVEISVKERQQKPDGTEDLPPTKDLAIFPPQLIIPPQEKRSIRVQWLGEKPKAERAFRVIAEQLPLQVDGNKKKSSGIKMLLKYVAALYVNPGNTEADIKVIEVVAGSSLTVVVENSGSAHKMLLEPTLTLMKGKESIKLSGDQLQGLAGENILAGSRRSFQLPAQVKVVGDGFTGTLKVD